jgi:aryl-alcohol dehydrogenase-like predicted oxidoreductase
MWFAGAGLAGGRIVGATDEFGLHAVESRAHVHDIHATILELLGLDHTQLLYLHQGRPERPTVNEGKVIDELL